MALFPTGTFSTVLARFSMLLRVAAASLRYRSGSVLLTIVSVAVSVFVLMGVEHLRQEAKSSFTSTISGVDLIIGAPTGQLNLLLYSVFRLGTPTNNIAWESYQAIAQSQEVAWSVPLSLGDSHRGFRVVGTNADFFTRYRYGRDRALELAQGERFEELFDVVIGSEVARRLGYEVGQSLVLAHGIAATSFSMHADRPFKVSGVLRATGTPVDTALYVSLGAIEAIHRDTPVADLGAEALQPQAVTAALVGLKSRITTFHVQRRINSGHYGTALLAILPGVALTELWQMVGMMEKTLRALSVMIFTSAMLGLAAMLLASMRERKVELVIMRTLGARPGYLFVLLAAEALLIVTVAVVVAIVGLLAMLALANQHLVGIVGMALPLNFFNTSNLIALAGVLTGALLVSFLPAWKAYRMAL